MKQITEDELLNLLKNDVQNEYMVSYKRYLDHTDIFVVRLQQERRVNMKTLTNSELETLKEAEDILFSHLDSELEDIFSSSAIALHIAIKNYTRLVLKDIKHEHKKPMENYVKKWYNKK